MAGYRVIAPEGVEFKHRKYRPGESFEAHAEEVAGIRGYLEKLPAEAPPIDLGLEAEIEKNETDEEE